MPRPTKSDCVPSATYDWSTDGHEWLDWRRARVVLGNMWTYGSITESQYDDALKQVHDMLANQQVLQWAGLTNGSALDTTKLAPSFVDYVLDQLVTQFGVDDKSLATAGWKFTPHSTSSWSNTLSRTSTTISTSITGAYIYLWQRR